ncbi:hypothetical protein HG531_012704 [Fusarium graminearum]|nr:hypothetical protein HG531_012704 [Fusarium graminearum]
MDINQRNDYMKISLALAQSIGELVQGTSDELGLLPEVGGEETVGVGDGNESSLEGVLEGLGGTGRGCVGVLDTGELEESLDSGGGNEARYLGSDCTYTDGDGTTLSALLGGQRVDGTKVGTPVTTTDGDDAELSDDDGGTDSGGNLLGGLDTETDVALGVTNDDNGLESGSLTGTGLLLDGLDL